MAEQIFPAAPGESMTEQIFLKGTSAHGKPIVEHMKRVRRKERQRETATS